MNNEVIVLSITNYNTKVSFDQRWQASLGAITGVKIKKRIKFP
jgi:hypothetical protein